MYAGHFAVGLALKARFNKVPAVPIFLGIGMLDIIHGILTTAGIELVSPNPASGPYLFFDLSWIDWSHSLLMAVVWSLAWGMLFMKNPRVALIAAAAVFSHFLLDWPVHNHDLAIYPYGAYHTGLGLWGSLGVGSWLLEGAFCLPFLIFSWREGIRRGVRLFWPALLLLGLFLNLSPWLSPMKIVAHLHEPLAHIAYGLMAVMGCLLAGLLMSWLVNRAEETSG
jgi:hypothetical protein